MKSKGGIYLLAAAVSVLIGFFFYESLIETDFVRHETKLEISLNCYQRSEMQFFMEDDKQFKEANMRAAKVDAAQENCKVSFDMPFIYNPGRIRIDPGFTRGKWLIKKITLKGLSGDIVYTPEEIIKQFEPVNDIKEFKLIPNVGVMVESKGQDPYLISKFSYATFFYYLNSKPSIYFIPLLLSFCIALFCFILFKAKLNKLDFGNLSLEHVFVFTFLLILCLPLVWMTFFPSRSGSGENRELRSKPLFSLEHVMEYPKLLNGYFEDNFGFKKSLSTLNSYYKLKLFHSSSKPELVVVGKNSWLFSTDQHIVGDYQNRKLYTSDELATIKSNLEEASDWYKERGIRFYVLIMPLKSNIYPEYLPSSIQRQQEESKLTQLANYMAQNSKVRFVDVSNELKASKSGCEVYYQHDIHMNFAGGFITYSKLIKEIAKNDSLIIPQDSSNYKRVMKHIHNADLSRQLSLEDVLLNDEWNLEKKKKVTYKAVDAPVYETVSALQPAVRTKNKNTKLPKAVVFRDSFFNLIMPYFSENFSDCIYLWTNEMSAEVIQKEKPNYVIYEMLESGLDKLLDDNPPGIKKQ